MKEKKHVLRILKSARKATKDRDIVKIKELSNQTIHSASIYQDIEYILIAVIVYSLSKLIERTNYKKYSGWSKFFKSFIKHLDKAITYLEKNKDKKFVNELESIRNEIKSLTGNLKNKIAYIFEKAKINKSSRIYEHGVSMERAARILGISSWELAEYVGKTGISDINLSITVPIQKRIKTAEDILK